MTSHSSSGPSSSARTRSPLFGTTTFSTLTTSGTPMSPSRYSYSYASSRSVTPRQLSEDDDDDDRQMRRIVVSPSASPRTSTFDTYSYPEDNSIDDAAEVEAALALIDSELSNVEDAVTEWSSRDSSYSGPSYSSYTPSAVGSYSSYTGSQTGSYTHSASQSGSHLSTGIFSPAPTMLDREKRLSTITERSENVNSRPTSFSQLVGNRNSGASGEAARRSVIEASAAHGRSATEPVGERATTPIRRTGELIAFFEDKKAFGHSRNASAPSGVRSPSPFTMSPSLPTLSNTTGYGYGSSTYGYSSRPSSPTKSRAATSTGLMSPPTRPTSIGESRTTGTSTYTGTQTQSIHTDGSSMFTGTQTYNGGPSTFTGTQSQSTRTSSGTVTQTQGTLTGELSTITGTTGTYTGTQTRTGSGYMSTGTTTSNTQSTNINTFATSSDATPTTSSLRRPQTSPRSPLSSVRNIVAAWKERTPSLSKKPPQGEGLFSLRRRADRGSMRLRENALRNIKQEGVVGDRRTSLSGNGVGTPRSGSGSLGTSGLLPPPPDVAELGNFANIRESQEPLRIGLLWYLNVHAPPPYRWQRCQAVLYPHMLLLSWIASGGGRGIVNLDLLNCTEVRSVPSPTHPSARDDIGTVAARMQSENAEGSEGIQIGEMELIETLCPFQLLYSDGVERLGAESARERVRWVSAIWEALDRSVTIPDRSQSGSPTGSIRTMRSITSSIHSSSSSKTGSGSASTVFVPPLDSIPDLSDIQSLSGASSASLTRRTSLVSSHHIRATDDNAVSGQNYLYPGDPRVIAPSRSSSIRRTSSLTDLDEEFATAVRRARDARPGLGFGLALAGVPMGDGSPVTISSGSRLNGDVRVTPPPSLGRGRGTRGSDTSTTSISDDLFFSAGSGSSESRSGAYSLSSITSPNTKTTTGTGTGTGLKTDETITDVLSGTETQTFPSSLSYRSPSSTSYLDDLHSGSASSYSYSHSTSSRSFLARTREVVRRRRLSSRTYSSTHQSGSEDSSDKENSASSASYTGYTGLERSDFSTLESYTFTSGTTSRSRTPARTRSSDEQSVLSDDKSEDFTPVEEKTPSTASFASLPTIPSETSFRTVDECATDYLTAEKCASDILTEYSTAELCSSKPSTEYVTCEICGSDASTEYGSAECRCVKARVPVTEPSTRADTDMEEEEEVRSILAPSIVPTIPSPAFSEESLHPENIPLPSPTTGSRSPSISSRLSSLSGLRELTSPTESSSISVPTTESSSSVSISGPSSQLGPSEPTVSISISSPTESSVTSTATPSELTPSVPSPAPEVPTPTFTIADSFPSISVTEPSPQRPQPRIRSSPSLHPSQWGEETDFSYDSSVLRPSTSASVAAPEGPDISFETSGMRPSASQPSETLTSPTPFTGTPTPLTSITPSSPSSPSSPTTSITPTPSSVSTPTPVPTPSSSSVSFQQDAPTLTRTPSSISTVSSVSMGSSIFETESALGEPILEEPSTEPSLSLTGRSHSPLRPVSPREIPLPRSPSLATPPGTIEVSVATPRGDVPSIHSQIRTIITEPPGQILTHDVNRLLQYLHEITAERDNQHAELVENIRAIEDELLDLSDHLRRREEAPAPAPPPVPTKDKGISPPTRILPMGPRAPSSEGLHPLQHHLIPIPLTPPPQQISSPSSLTSIMSFLSSHHSDDLSLYPESEPDQIQPEEQFEMSPSPSSPSWPSESSEDDTSSFVSSELSSEPLTATVDISDPTPSSTSSGEYLSRTSDEPSRSLSPLRIPAPTPTRTSVSPTPSASSVSTVRASEQATLANLRTLLEGLREQTAALAQGQANTNQILDELRERTDEPSLRRIEDLLQRILDRSGAPPSRETVEMADETASEASSGRLRRRLEDLLHRRRDQPFTIHQPTPVRASRTDDLLPDFFAPPMPIPPTVGQPPPLVPFTYQPVPRPPRSVSPTADLPSRPPTMPILHSMTSARIPHRPPPTRHRPRATRPRLDTRRPAESAPIVELADEPPTRPGTAAGTEAGPSFLAQVRNGRRARVPGSDGFYGPLPASALHDGVQARPPTAPPDLGGEPAPGSESWYRRRRQQQPAPVTSGVGMGVPPPGVFSGVPQPAAPANPFYVLPNDTAPSDTLLRDILDVMRDNRSFQMASVEQQNMLIDHLNRLNQWLTGDQQDRQAELRGVCARVDQLRNDLNRLYQGQSQLPIGMPQPQVVIPPVGSVQPPPSSMGGQQIPMPPGVPGFPGFVPQQMQPGPTFLVPPVVPSQVTSESSSGEYSPVIPPRPATGWGQDQPVVPDLGDRPALQQQEPYVHRPPARRESDEEESIIIPPQPSARVTVQPPLFIPPPPVMTRPHRQSSSSVTGSSSSTPPQMIPMEHHMIHPSSSRRSRSRSESSRRSHTPPPPATTIVNVQAPAPAQPLQHGVAPMGPMVNVVPPSSPSVRHDLTPRPAYPPIIIQPPLMPMQQAGIHTVLREPRSRRRRPDSYSTTTSSSSSRSRSSSRRRRTPPPGPGVTVLPITTAPSRPSHRSHSRSTRSQSPLPAPPPGQFIVQPPGQGVQPSQMPMPQPAYMPSPSYIPHVPTTHRTRSPLRHERPRSPPRTRSRSSTPREYRPPHEPRVVVVPTTATERPPYRDRGLLRRRSYSRSPSRSSSVDSSRRRRRHRPHRYTRSLSTYSSDPSYRRYARRLPHRYRSDRDRSRSTEGSRGRGESRRGYRSRSRTPERYPYRYGGRRAPRRSVSAGDVPSPTGPHRLTRDRDPERGGSDRSITPVGRRHRPSYETSSPGRVQRRRYRGTRYGSRSRSPSTISTSRSPSRRRYAPAAPTTTVVIGPGPSGAQVPTVMRYGEDRPPGTRGPSGTHMVPGTHYEPGSPRGSQFQPPGTPRGAQPVQEPLPGIRTGHHILPPESLRDQLAAGDTAIPYYPSEDDLDRAATPPLTPLVRPARPGTQRSQRAPTAGPPPSTIAEEEPEEGSSRSGSPRSAVRVPPPGTASRRGPHRTRTVSGPRDLAFADGERERQERFEDLERHLHDAADAVNAAEDRREHIFRENEEARERIFSEAEQQRAEEAMERRNQIWRDLEDRLNLTALPVPPPGSTHLGGESDIPAVVHEDDAASMVESMRNAAARHAEEIMETVRLEREQMDREREAAFAERERLLAEAREERAALEQEREARIKALEEELTSVKGELEAERQLRITEESERRERENLEDLQRDEVIRNQLGDITNLVQEQRDECARKKQLMDDRWDEKMHRRAQKDNQLSGLYDMINRIIDDREAERVRLDEERTAAEARPGIERVLEELARQNTEQRELLDQMAESWRNDNIRNRDETMKAIRETAHEQVPFNVQGYLDEFSKSLASEVRMLLNEVGKLREEKRNLQYELGCLMCMKSKYGPGGEFDPDWKPSTGTCAACTGRGGGAPPPDDQPPPEAPPPPEPARPAWRTVQQRVSRKSKKPKEAPPPPEPEPRPPVSSWATWRPDDRFVPTPPTIEPTLLVPPRGSPGLFGPRSPRDSLNQ